MRISDWSSDVCSSDLAGRQGWRAINSTLGVARPVAAAADAPIAVSEAVIEGLRAREGKDGCVRLEPQRHLQNGDEVRVTEGAFESFLDRKSTRLNSSH